jgi:hypothetical protein
MEREKHDQYSEYKQVMANADPPHSQFMELIDVARSLSEKNRIQLISRSLVAALRVLFENELTRISRYAGVACPQSILFHQQHS